MVYSSKYSSVPGLLPVTSGRWTPLILNLALSKLPPLVCPATVKRTLFPGFKFERSVELSLFQLVSNAGILRHCAVGGGGVGVGVDPGGGAVGLGVGGGGVDVGGGGGGVDPGGGGGAAPF